MRTADQLPGQSAMGASALDRDRLDHDLLRSIAAGDKNAMRVLFHRHSVPVYRFALRLVEDVALAEDIVSEVFIAAWHCAHSFKAKSRVTTWLLAIARHQARSALRRRSQARPDEHAAAEVVDRGDDPEVVMHERDRRQLVRMCLGRLPPSHREIIDLVYYHEKSIDEVAEIVGVSMGTIKSRVMLARCHMARLLTVAGVDGL